MGIGINNPQRPLCFSGNLEKKISLYHGTTGDAGFGVFANELRIHSDYANADITFGYDDYTSGFTEKMRLKGNGNVGIGLNNPGYTLEVARGSRSGTATFRGTSYYSDINYGSDEERISVPEKITDMCTSMIFPEGS